MRKAVLQLPAILAFGKEVSLKVAIGKALSENVGAQSMAYSES